MSSLSKDLPITTLGGYKSSFFTSFFFYPLIFLSQYATESFHVCLSLEFHYNDQLCDDISGFTSYLAYLSCFSRIHCFTKTWSVLIWSNMPLTICCRWWNCGEWIKDMKKKMLPNDSPYTILRCKKANQKSFNLQTSKSNDFSSLSLWFPGF